VPSVMLRRLRAATELLDMPDAVDSLPAAPELLLVALRLPGAAPLALLLLRQHALC
jgi:hypothetical protein